MSKRIWIIRDYMRCSGCRRCEIACSLSHEGKIWPEASCIRIFAPFPGLEVPHLCVQCDDYPCVEACPADALSVDEKTGAVIVDKEKCTGCGVCVEACPGKIPYMHPTENYAVICDLCGGKPKCVEVCSEAGYNALRLSDDPGINKKVHAVEPEVTAKDLAVNLFGEKGEEVI